MVITSEVIFEVGARAWRNARWAISEYENDIVSIIIGAVEPVIRMSERERLLSEAASVVVCDENGQYKLNINDQHQLGWTPITIELIVDLVAQLNEDRNDLRNHQ